MKRKKNIRILIGIAISLLLVNIIQNVESFHTWNVSFYPQFNFMFYEDVKSEKDFFPLSLGMTWIYEKEIQEGMEQEQTFIVKEEVVEIINRNNLTGAVIKETNLTKNEQSIVKYIIVRVGNSIYYSFDRYKGEFILKRLRDNDDNLYDLVESRCPFLHAPLSAGDIFGDPKSITRDDAMYSWHVISKEKVHLYVDGLESNKLFDQYTMEFRTCPDQKEVKIVPHIGIVEEHYKHHGYPYYIHKFLIKCYLK
ncbi:MAG: hypothetical protein ABRQ39_22185 [Candidatus Eremiobacterota bacterium]